MKKLLLTMALIMGASNAHADFAIWKGQVVHNETKEAEKVLVYQGDFEFGSNTVLESALSANPDYNTVIFNSPGGHAEQAFLVGNVLDQYEVKAWVPKGRSCVSACALAFLGAHDYRIGGTLAFHSAYIADEGWDAVKENNAMLGEAYRSAQGLGMYLTYYIVANGFSFDFAYDIVNFTHPTEFLTFKSEDELYEYYAREELADDKLEGYFVKQSQADVLTGLELYEYAAEQRDDLENTSTRSFELEEELFNNFEDTQNEEDSDGGTGSDDVVNNRTSY